MNDTLKPVLWVALGASLSAVVSAAVFHHSKQAREPVSPSLASPTISEAPTTDLDPDPSRLPKNRGAAALPDRTGPTPHRDLEELIKKIDAGSATRDEQHIFWDMVQESPEFEALLEQFEDRVASDESPVQSRLDLAELYTLKLLSESSDPVRGLWGMKATGLWREVLEIDATNWEAQHSIAFSLSQYPEFLNKTDEAIAAYQKLISFPTTGFPSPERARAYLELTRLYKKKGLPSDALATLEAGILLHPNHGPLRNEVEALRRQYTFEE